MAETHAGITNENSFFSDHYLVGLPDLVGASWQQQGLGAVSISLILVPSLARDEESLHLVSSDQDQ